MSDSVRRRRTPLLWITVAALLGGILGFPPQAQALQQRQGAARDTVVGRVTDAQTGQPVPGVVVQAAGTRATTLTDGEGRYRLAAPANGALVFAHLAYRNTSVDIGGRRQVDVALQTSAVQLAELVVTGYATQRRGEITGSVASVNIKAAETQTSSSMLQRLDGTVAGVAAASGGAPGTRSTVRIRGITSFQNNDPLYVVDGTPVEESYMNFLDPNDIESIQVLKDASAASIYGSRASNGVVIVETKKGGGGAPQITMNAKFGMASPVKGYNSILIQNPLDYFQVEKASYENSGQKISPQTTPAITAIFGDPNNPSIPQYIWAEGSALTGTDQWGRFQVDPSKYSYPNTLVVPASQGTDWWGAVFRPAPTRDVNIGVSGGSGNARYYSSFGYFDQNGTAIGSRFTRGTVRLNTEFNSGKLRVGENLNLSLELSHGQLGNDVVGENNIVGKNVFQQSIIPLKDVAGNFASGKANGLGNATNPLKLAQNELNNINTNTRMFGNVFGAVQVTPDVTVRSTLGFNLGQGAYRAFFPPTFENSEEGTANSFQESHNYGIDYTENTTLNFHRAFAGVHNATILLGQEAQAAQGRNEFGSIGGLVSTALPGRYIQDALADPTTKNVNSGGYQNTLLSFFGKANYDYNDTYYLSGTLRRDGSSKFGPANRWGLFPAFSAGWRVSRASFLKQSSSVSNLMLRFGYGVTGNQAIPAGATVNQFGGGTGSTFYNVNGDGNTIVTGYRQTAIGNPDLRWERDKSSNVGLDAELFGKADVSIDIYRRDSDDLLFAPDIPATQGQATPPIVNIGAMRNTGVDFTIGYRGTFGRDGTWNVNFNGSHYKNQIVSIAGDQTSFFGPIGTRQNAHVTINKLGEPVGSFYGYKANGYFQTQKEIDDLNTAARQKTGDPTAVYEQGAKPGRIKFVDVNGDGIVTGADETTIGSALPSFLGGLNFGVNKGRFDVAASVFGTFGNKIYNAQKEFDVFRGFNLNVRKDLLANSWTCASPSADGSCPNGAKNPNAKYPRLDVTDNVSQQPSSYYVESGTYVRLRSVQVGYRIPKRYMQGFGDVRVYLEAENLFTITGYSELDPALPAENSSTAVGDVRDQARGIDQGVYPTSRIFSVGFNVSF